VTSGASGTGNGSAGYSAAANTTTSARNGTLTVAGTTFTVTEAATSCSYALSGTSQALSVDGGTGTVTVTTGAGCAWTAASNNTPWLTVTSGASGSGGGSVGFSATANNQTTTKSGTLTIAGNTFTVTEAACGYTLTPTSQSLGSAGGTGTVTVATGSACPWTATSNATWISLTSATSAIGSGSITYSVAGSGGTTRSGTLTVGGQTFTVNESGCSFTVSPKTISAPATSLVGLIDVSTAAGCFWTTSSPVSWLTLSSGGAGPGTVSYTLTSNTSSVVRTANIVVAGQTIGVTQAGTTATPPPPPSGLRVVGGGGD
jgi:all-beta uncharacterized protein/BACON domain-containing protein